MLTAAHKVCRCMMIKDTKRITFASKIKRDFTGNEDGIHCQNFWLNTLATGIEEKIHFTSFYILKYFYNPNGCRKTNANSIIQLWSRLPQVHAFRSYLLIFPFWICSLMHHHSENFVSLPVVSVYEWRLQRKRKS